jgi:hypothetical protein
MSKERIEKYLATQEKNLVFITERLRIQSEPNYTPYKKLFVGLVKKGNGFESQYISIKERCYNEVEIDLIKEKIELAKKYLEVSN